MERFLLFLIRALLKYIVLPAVLFFGLLLLSTSPLKLIVTFAVIGICWWWKARRQTAADMNTSASSRMANNASGKAGVRRSQTTRPRSATAFQQRPMQYRAKRPTSGTRSTNDSSHRRQGRAGAHFQQHEDLNRFMHTGVDDDDLHAQARTRQDEDLRDHSSNAWMFHYGDHRAGMSRPDPFEDADRRIRGDPPYDDYHHFNR